MDQLMYSPTQREVRRGLLLVCDSLDRADIIRNGSDLRDEHLRAVRMMLEASTASGFSPNYLPAYEQCGESGLLALAMVVLYGIARGFPPIVSYTFLESLRESIKLNADIVKEVQGLVGRFMHRLDFEL